MCQMTVVGELIQELADIRLTSQVRESCPMPPVHQNVQLEVDMVSNIQNWAFAEQKTVAATISVHTHTHTPPHFQKLLRFRPL